MPIITLRESRKDGTIRVTYRADAGPDPLTGKRRRKRFDRRGDALTWLHDQPKAAGEFKPLTVAELGEKHVADRKAAGRERSTYDKYQEHFELHITAIVLDAGELKGQTLKDVQVAQLRPVHLIQLKQQLVATRSHKMAMRIWSTLTAALSLAVALEIRDDNPALSIKIDSQRRPESDPEEDTKIPPKADIATLFNALVRRHNEPLTLGQVFVQTMLGAGLRPSEGRALAWPQIHHEGNNPHLRVIGRVDEWNVFGPPKSAAGYRDVPLPASLASMLKEWKLACPKSGDRQLVFPTSTGHYQNPANLHNRVWVPLQKAIGLCDPVLGPDGNMLYEVDETTGIATPVTRHRHQLYSLRHAYASIQIELGMDPKTLQHRMGHASIQVTMDIYGHLWKNRSKDAENMVALDRWFRTLPSG